MAIIFLAAGVLVYQASENRGLSQLHEEVSHQLDILASAIDSEVTRHATTPSAVELSPDVLALLRAPDSQKVDLQKAANVYLQN